MAAVTFRDKETEFRDWRRDNPDGYILNTTREPSEQYLVQHKARCWTISGEPSRGSYWTKDFIKICAGDRRETDDWVKQQRFHAIAKLRRFCLESKR
ncbi:MAG: hypothetical protein ACM3WU_03140 [Bacillota bacterium]